jgi:hypothetical protein
MGCTSNYCRVLSCIAYNVSALLACSSETALSIAMDLNWNSLQFGITPFNTFTQDSCAARISSGLNIGVWEGVLMPQDCSGRNDRRGGGGGGFCAAWKAS